VIGCLVRLVIGCLVRLVIGCLGRLVIGCLVRLQACDWLFGAVAAVRNFGSRRCCGKHDTRG